MPDSSQSQNIVNYCKKMIHILEERKKGLFLQSEKKK